ncbi:MAG: CehA/McbA family metallohydrolase [Planctomycetes bacterium]|nr:CehA/McbA family metallohydrolase [Planctomycetota bacterium]
MIQRLTALLVALAGTLCFACAPGESTFRLYWGDLHTHSTFSDGCTSVEEVLKYARDTAGLDFVAVTDHDFGNQAPWRLSTETWNDIQSTCARLTQARRFIALPGYEWTSQAKYWTGYSGPEQSEGLFVGPPRYFNHKNVYFAHPVRDIFRAAVGGLVQNNHPSTGLAGRDQWQFTADSARIIANTEMAPDVASYHGVTYEMGIESTIREFLDRGGITGFVGGSDTHEGRPAVRTAVWSDGLTQCDLLSAFRARRNYALSGARIVLDFRINGRWMGERIITASKPRLRLCVRGTAPIAEVLVVRGGAEWLRIAPFTPDVHAEFVDESFPGECYYYVRITQADSDAHGNPSRAWSSPIWVSSR